MRLEPLQRPFLRKILENFAKKARFWNWVHLYSNLARLSCGWLPMFLPHKSEKKPPRFSNRQPFTLLKSKPVLVDFLVLGGDLKFQFLTFLKGSIRIPFYFKYETWFQFWFSNQGKFGSDFACDLKKSFKLDWFWFGFCL